MWFILLYFVHMCKAGYGLHVAQVCYECYIQENYKPTENIVFLQCFWYWIPQTWDLKFVNNSVSVSHKVNLCIVSLFVHICSFSLITICGFQYFLPKAESSGMAPWDVLCLGVAWQTKYHCQKDFRRLRQMNLGKGSFWIAKSTSMHTVLMLSG